MVSVASCELAVVYPPVNVFAHVTEPTEQSTVFPAVATAVPVPVSVTLCGEPVAVSVSTTLALEAPEAAGVNLTEIVQVVKTPVAQVLVCEKELAFVPESAMLEIVTDAVPVLVTVTVWAVDVVPTVPENVRDVALNDSVAVKGAVVVVPPPPLELVPLLHPVNSPRSPRTPAPNTVSNRARVDIVLISPVVLIPP